jgi:DNA-binding transcriptional MocR family regulator
LAEQGIAVTPSYAFAASGHYPHAIRLNLGAASLDTLAQALPVVRDTIEAMALA